LSCDERIWAAQHYYKTREQRVKKKWQRKEKKSWRKGFLDLKFALSPAGKVTMIDSRDDYGKCESMKSHETSTRLSFGKVLKTLNVYDRERKEKRSDFFPFYKNE